MRTRGSAAFPVARAVPACPETTRTDARAVARAVAREMAPAAGRARARAMAIAVACALLLALLLALPLFTPGSTAHAETLVVDEQVIVRPSDLQRPLRGTTMSAVEARFGAPVARHDTVGEPPITRWDYAGFSVFFEHDKVIDSVVTGN